MSDNILPEVERLVAEAAEITDRHARRARRAAWVDLVESVIVALALIVALCLVTSLVEPPVSTADVVLISASVAGATFGVTVCGGVAGSALWRIRRWSR